jgi:lysophospholipase L1-like esterase
VGVNTDIAPTTGDIVMIGDSLTDFAEWNEIFPGKSIINKGISGNTTGDILNRMDDILSVGAKKAFIMAGINDFARCKNVDDVATNYSVIIKRLQKNVENIYIQSTPFCNVKLAPVEFNCEETNKKIAYLNPILAKLAKQNSLIFIDTNSILSKNSELDPDLTWDGVHLNSDGYQAIKSVITPYLR